MSNASITLGEHCASQRARIRSETLDQQFLETLFLKPAPGTPVGTGLVAQTEAAPSKLYTASTDINPLVAAAAPLLSLIAPLKQSQHCAQVTQLQQQLLHEIRAFESQAHEQGYPNALIFATRFALCANIDEAIGHTPWGQHSDWPQHGLTQHLFGDGYTLEHFYTLTRQLQLAPEEHIDALELLYVCLSLGFSGVPRGTRNAHHEARNELMDELYEQIRAVRGDFDKTLTPHWPTHAAPTVTTKTPFPWWLSMLLSGILLLTIYTGFSTMLNTAKAPVYHTLADIEQTLMAPMMK